MRLEFHGVQGDLLPALLVGVSAALCAWGAAQVLRRQRRSGLVNLAAGIVGLLAVILDWGVFRDTGPFAALLAVQLAVAVGAIYSVVYAHLGGRRLAVLAALRLGAILALLLILAKPVLLVLPSAARKPVLAILVDRSGSMSTTDSPGQGDRYSRCLQMLRSQNRRISEAFRPLWFTFAATASPADSPADLSLIGPTGRGTEATDLVSALQVGRSAAPTTEQAGVLLLSDGIHNVAGDPVEAAKKSAVPIYTVVVGQAATPGRANLELLGVEAPLEAAIDHACELKARVRMTRWANTAAQVRLYEGDASAPSATQTALTASDDATVAVRLPWTPRRGGGDVRVICVEVDGDGRESTRDDNRLELHVLVTSRNVRVLYVEGAIRPEYKFLRRFLQGDKSMDLLALVRLGEGRFWAQGNLGGKTLNTLPIAEEDFRLFDVLILGDLDRSFLSDEQMRRIRAFVLDGGGLLMIGGRNSFGPGGYGGTDVEAALPVNVGGRGRKQSAQPFLPQLTAEGEVHPIFSGVAGYFPGPNGRALKPGLAKLPDLRGCVEVVSAKDGAAILAVHPAQRNAAGPLVVLAVQSFGAGRSAAFTADTTWQWRLPLQALGADSPYDRFWGQMIRWLGGAEAKAPLSKPAAVLRLERTYLAVGVEAKLLGRVRLADGQPAANARVFVSISPAGDDKAEARRTVSLAAGPSPGSYQGAYTPDQPGRYTLRMTARDENDAPLAEDRLDVTVAEHSMEMERLTPDDRLLRGIAEASGGEYADLSALPDVLDRLIERRRRSEPGGGIQTFRLYHFPVLFGVFVVLLTAEWLLRRTWRLP